jgi:iron complex outermembrane receptor protein
MRQSLDPIVTAVALGIGCFAAAPVLAQTRVDEVIVTTGFRSEPLTQSVGSTSVVDASLVREREAQHLETIIDTVPNVTMTSGSSRGRFVQIRGIGDLEQFVDPKHYPSVGISVDGIDLGGIANAAMLFDVDQVEVLRGPQGTVFGASALAGQINIRTIAPSETFDAYIDAGLADYGTAMFGFAAGGAIADELAGRIAVQKHQSDGYIENAYLGRDDTNGYDETTLRAKMRWTPRETATFDVTAMRFESDNGYDAFSLDNTRTTLSDQPGHDNLSLSALGLKGGWELESGGSVEASLSWVDSGVDYGFDEDWSYVGLCDGTLCNPGDEFSNTDRYMRDRNDTSFDLRWLGEGRSDTRRSRRYVLGLYAQDRSESLDRQYYGPFSSDYSTDRTALYGQIQAGIADRLELTAGFRLERFDDRYSDSNAFASDSDDVFHSGELALSWSATDRSTLYALVSRGNKPGGVNTEASSIYGLLEPRFQAFLGPRLAFASERLTNIEIGVKSALLDDRLSLRAALFRMSRDDAQLESWFLQYVPFLWVGILDNADGDNLGSEVELDFDVSERWRLRASLGLLDTEIDALTTFDLDLDQFVDRSGIDQAKAPAWQAYLGSEWVVRDDWRIAVDIDARDAERYGYYHDGMLDRATLVNASVRRTIGGAELTLWARNLFDEDVAVHGLYFGNDPRKGYANERYLQLGEPRLVGMSVRYSF